VVAGYKFSVKDFETRDMPIARTLASQMGEERREIPKSDIIETQMFDKSGH
jgi:hypothetical protein